MKIPSIPALICDNVSVRHQRHHALTDVSVTIEQGALVAVVGPNGAGKTSLIQAILTITPLASGTISILGKPHTQQTNLCAYVAQRSSIDWDFPISVLEVVLMGTYGKLGWFQRPGIKEYDAAYAALDAVHMTAHAHTPIGNLSGGQQQRVFVARALVQDAQLYIFDEPFIGIDHTTERIIVQKLQELHQQGKTIIVVHHDLNTVANYFDTMLLLNKTCIAYGPSATILQKDLIRRAYQTTHFEASAQ